MLDAKFGFLHTITVYSFVELCHYEYSNFRNVFECHRKVMQNENLCHMQDTSSILCSRSQPGVKGQGYSSKVYHPGGDGILKKF